VTVIQTANRAWMACLRSISCVFYNIKYFVQNTVASQTLFLQQKKLKWSGGCIFKLFVRVKKKLGHPLGVHLRPTTRVCNDEGGGKLGFTRSPYPSSSSYVVDP